MKPSPATAVLRRNLAIALSHNSLEEAGQLLERLKVEEPLSKETRTLELELLFKSGRTSESEALKEDLLAHYPGSPRVRHLAGRIDYARRSYAEALQHFEEAQRLFPHWVTERYRGKTLTQLGRLADAEAILEPLSREHPEVLSDLAWLHERKGDLSRAVDMAERLASLQPQNAFAREMLQRLRARSLQPVELREEVESLLAVGEDVPQELLVRQAALLLQQGEGKAAREFVNTHRSKLEDRALLSLGWECYKLQAYDLAFELFAASIETRSADFKMLAAFEKSAEMCGRLHEVFELYKARAPEHKHLYGRMRSLAKRRG